jgi:Ran GTPase-activating protein (RanGAP) involved in mRNA processing and transport
LKQFKENNTTELFVRFLKVSSEEAKQISTVLSTSDKIDRFVMTSNPEIKVEDLKVIAEGLSKNKNVRVVGLTKTKIGDEGAIPFIEALKGHPTLQKFYLYSLGVTEKSVQSIADNFGENKALTKIVVIENKLSDAGIKILSQFIQKKATLTDLTIRDTKFGPEGYKDLAAALKNSNIKKLDVSENQMDEASVQLFSEVLSSSKLTQVELSFNGLNSKSVELISKGVEGSKTIVKIDLSENKIEDEGAKYIADLITKNPTVEKIDLSNNNITNAGVKAIIEAMDKNKTIKKVYVYRNSLTQEIKELLEKNEERVKSEIGDELRFGKDDPEDFDETDGKEMKDEEDYVEDKEDKADEEVVDDEKPEDDSKIGEHPFLKKEEKKDREL